MRARVVAGNLMRACVVAGNLIRANDMRGYNSMARMYTQLYAQEQFQGE